MSDKNLRFLPSKVLVDEMVTALVEVDEELLEEYIAIDKMILGEEGSIDECKNMSAEEKEKFLIDVYSEVIHDYFIAFSRLCDWPVIQQISDGNKFSDQAIKDLTERLALKPECVSEILDSLHLELYAFIRDLPDRRYKCGWGSIYIKDSKIFVKAIP